MNAVAHGLERYLSVFTNLKPDDLEPLRACFSEQACFKDPLNDVRGSDNIIQIFEHMYHTLDEPRFRMTASARDGAVALLHWALDFRLRDRIAQLQIVGISKVTYTDDGRVAEHIDHWDPAEQVYGKIPLLRTVLRWVRQRLSASS